MRSKRLIVKETVSVKATTIQKPEKTITRASLRRRLKVDQGNLSRALSETRILMTLF
jgi:hypothetical protein